MVNGIGVLGWGVGGIEAEAAMLGQPIAMLIPDVIGFRLTGKLPEGVTATDLALTVTQMLRKKGVVGKFVEFFGAGLAELPLADRAHHRQHGPGIRRHLRLLPGRPRDPRLPAPDRPRRGTGSRWSRPTAKAQGMWRRPATPDPVFTDIARARPRHGAALSIAGPKRPQDRVPLKDAAAAFARRPHQGPGRARPTRSASA